MNQLTSQAGREAALRQPQPQEQRREVPLQLVLQSLFSRDPVDSSAAAEEIAARGEEAIGAVVEGLHGNAEQTNLILRGLLSRFPEASAPGLLERVEAAESNWHLATQIPDVLAPPHAPFCEERLRALIDAPEMDVERKAIEALGYLGAVERAPTICEVLKKAVSDSYRYDKIYRYGIEALARIVSLAPMEAAYGGVARLAFEELETALALPLPDGYPTIASAGLQKILSRCRPHHGDRFVKVWLTSPVKEVRQLGAYALGGIGADWAIAPLLKVASDSGEAAEVRRTATLAIAVIGGAEACRALESLEEEAELDGVLWTAFCMTVEHARDSRFPELVSTLLDRAPAEVCLVYRAIGRRGDEDLIDLVREGLRSEDGSIRADAALALARLAGADATDALRRSWAVAASTREKLLVSLALLAVGEEPPDDPELMELRRLLADESFLYWSLTQRDIIETLRDSSHPASTAIAAAWQPLYESTSSY
jgi:HEAT repeat protein